MRKKRLLIILGFTVAATAFCGGVEYFFFSNDQVHLSASPVAVNSMRQQVKTPTPNHFLQAPVAHEKSEARPSSPRSPGAKNSLSSRNGDSGIVASAPRPSSSTRALAGTDSAHHNEQVITPDPTIGEPSAPEPVSKSEISLAMEPALTAVEATPQEEASIAVPPAPLAQAEKIEPAKNGAKISEEDSEDTDLLIHPKLGYGMRYFEIQQSGAFGGIKGSNLAMNVFSLETTARYEAWRLQVGFEKFSSEFAGTTTDPNVKSEKDFRRFYFKPGYGIFFLGFDGQTAPIVRASGTTLQWADVTTLSVVGGLRFERLYYTRRRKKNFLLGFEVEGSYPLSANGGGSPSISSPSGFGLSLKGYVEKAIFRREDYSLYFGLDGSAAYDQLKFNGTWNGSSGDVTRTIQGYGSKVYLKLDF